MSAGSRIASIWHLMNKFDAGKLCAGVAVFAGLGHFGEIARQSRATTGFALQNYHWFLEAARDIIEQGEAAEIPLSVETAQEILSILESEGVAAAGLAVEAGVIGFPPFSIIRLAALGSELVGRVKSELGNHYVFLLDTTSKTLFEPVDHHFGQEVFNKFGSSREDIEEAGKCLALDRATAAVFHLMRALESAAQAIAKKIGATVADAHGRGLPWGVIADNMKPKIDAMPKGSSEQVQWYRVQQDLVTVNRAWRVPTNHPKETYTPRQAQEIFNATGALMRELAPLI